MRLFVAVNLPEHVRSDIWRATQELRDRDLPIRWVQADLLHLTVKFLGAVDAKLLPDVEERIADAAADTREQSVSIEGMGAFPSVRKPQTVWAGCDPTPALELLHHGVERRFADLGFPVEARPFHPHITVGRVKRGTPRRLLDGFGEELEQIQLSAVAAASSIELMESFLGTSGPRYRIVRSFEFGS